MKKVIALLTLIVCSNALSSQTLILSDSLDITFGEFRNCDTLIVNHSLAFLTDYDIPQHGITKKEVVEKLHFYTIDKNGFDWSTSRRPRKRTYKNKTIILYNNIHWSRTILNK
jgi:hypothetical protein